MSNFCAAAVGSLALLSFAGIVVARTRLKTQNQTTNGSPARRTVEHWRGSGVAEDRPFPSLPNWMRGQRLLASTACYGRSPKKEGYMRAALQEMTALAHAGMRVVMSIDVTEAWDGVFGNTTAVELRIRRFDPNVRFALVQRFQGLWAQSVPDFDWFLFFEDDLRVTADLIVDLLAETRFLSNSPLYPGPLRVEYDRTGRQYLTDFSTCTPPQVMAMWRVGDRVYVEPRNQYSAFTLVNRTIVDAALSTGEWPRKEVAKAWCEGPTMSLCPDRTFREQNSQLWPPTNFGYFGGSVEKVQHLRTLPDRFPAKKVVPLANLARFTVHHMSNCYTRGACSSGQTPFAWEDYLVPETSGVIECLGGAGDWSWDNETGHVLSPNFPASLVWDSAGGNEASPQNAKNIGWWQWKGSKPPPGNCSARKDNTPCVVAAKLHAARRKNLRRPRPRRKR
eukprot:Hpha_TRINITY_DN16932_c2_g1::TRINITY_DN16932_c2_g1_i1::g.51634::m.51634